MAAKRIPVAAIEQLQRALEGVPECHVKDVSKVRAVGMLTPQIRDMRAKGYSWKAIAEFLSERGIEVTAVTLKSYLNQARVVADKNASRRSKRRGPWEVSHPDARIEPGESIEHAAEVVAPTSPRGGRGAAIGGERMVPATIAQAAPVPVATPPAKGPQRTGDEGAPRRSAFLPKEDSKDI